ncbi:MAG: TAXI family TRAP transporter solute-binding subunit, partial [Spirochaetota bacterium]|nr:TAXI family TRAP transporter solute-binding subunit [Spirochaetota bacterium]
SAVCFLSALLSLSIIAYGCETKSGGKKSGGSNAQKKYLKFSGGPTGGTFWFFGSGISSYLSKNITNLKVSNETSEGSIENLRKLNSAQVDFGIVYSGDVYLARRGGLSGDKKKYLNTRAVAYLYKAPAQLAVLKKSNIKKVSDLQGKRVDIGGPGSGAAASAERYFKSLGLWDKIKVSTLGYSKAAKSMMDGQIDAMWVLVGYPTGALIELSHSKEIELLDLYDDWSKQPLKKSYPFYKALVIKSEELKGKYKGIARDTNSFFDSALWVASNKVSDDDVYNALKTIYTKEGLKYLINIKATARQMSIEAGVVGIVTPLHPGAYKFWKEKGLEIPAEAIPAEAKAKTK